MEGSLETFLPDGEALAAEVEDSADLGADHSAEVAQEEAGNLEEVKQKKHLTRCFF